MNALVGQLQPQRVLPVNPGPHRLRRLAVAEVVGTLHDANQSELPGMQRWLPIERVDSAEHLIGKQDAHLIAHPHLHVPGGKRGVRDTGSLSGNRL
jgi:hypothetical protein